VFGAAPVESFTVVMATGIVAVAARDDEHSVVAFALAVLAGGGLVLVVAWAALARAGAGSGVPCGARRIDHGFALFGFVAAVDVVAAQFDVRAAAGVVALLGAVAVVAWVLLVIHVAGLALGGGLATIRAGARGSLLLVVVAIQSLVLIAARLAVVVGPTAGALLVASAIGWVAGVLAYLVIARLVVARMLAARMAPALLTPDMWVLMGAVAIAVVAAGALLGAMPEGALRTAARAAVVGCWAVATAWIPALVAAEWRRVRGRRLRFERARWSTVFPLGMYVVACATVADTTSFTGLRAASAALYWVALAAWCLTTAGALSHAVKPHR
jgi:hypothetical protein